MRSAIRTSDFLAAIISRRDEGGVRPHRRVLKPFARPELAPPPRGRSVEVRCMLPPGRARRVSRANSRPRRCRRRENRQPYSRFRVTCCAFTTRPYLALVRKGAGGTPPCRSNTVWDLRKPLIAEKKHSFAGGRAYSPPARVTLHEGSCWPDEELIA